MGRTRHKNVALGLTAIGLSLVLSGAAEALPDLPVLNLTFTSYTGNAPKDYFSNVNPTGWYRGTPAPSGDLVFIDAPGTADNGSYLSVYGPFSNPPPGGNFVEADGNPDYFSTFKQDITGLTIGQQYKLSFWQAAGQQTTFTGATTEQWRVFLGTNGDTTDPEYDSPIMNTPSQGVSDWKEVTLTVTATAATNTLTFLAWGDNGSTENLPPIVFLAGVNTPAPEPASLAVLSVGLLGLGGVVRRRRARRDAGR